jgi:hypothetical protein
MQAAQPLAGHSATDLSNGRLPVSYATDAASGRPFIYIPATTYSWTDVARIGQLPATGIQTAPRERRIRPTLPAAIRPLVYCDRWLRPAGRCNQ